jgi:hypothetical protein
LNFVSLNNLAANSGMRTGMYYNHSDNIGIEMTLGVVGTSRPSTFATKVVPVEIAAHYNILSQFQGINTPHKFNIDAGLGSALVRAQSSTYNTAGRFSFSENASFGASLDLNVLPGGVLSFGFRHTLFVDDFIDADVSGSTNDHMTRFFTATRWNLGSSNSAKEDLKRAVERADQIAAELGAAEAKAKSLEKEAAKAKALAKELDEAKQALSDSTTALENLRKVEEEPVAKPAKAAYSGKGYAIIVGSYSDRGAAQNMADEVSENAKVIYVESIDKYRVAYDVTKSYGEAKDIVAELKDAGTSCWIVKL